MNWTAGSLAQNYCDLVKLGAILLLRIYHLLFKKARTMFQHGGHDFSVSHKPKYQILTTSLLISSYFFKKQLTHFLHSSQWSVTDPVHKPRLASFCFTSASDAGHGHLHQRWDWSAQAPRLPQRVRRLQAQAELASRQGSFQTGAVPLTPCAELPVGFRVLCLKMGKMAFPCSTENYTL